MGNETAPPSPEDPQKADASKPDKVEDMTDAVQMRLRDALPDDSVVLGGAEWEAFVTLLDGKNAKTLADAIQTFEMPHANVAAATDAGVEYKPINEDRVCVNTAAEFAAVVDGIGKHENADHAAQFLADALASNPFGAAEAIKRSQASMAMLKHNPGAVFISARIAVNAQGNKELIVEQAGDCGLAVIRADGAVAFRSKDQGYVQELVDAGEITEDEALYHKRRNIVRNAVKASEGTAKRYDPIFLQSGDRVYLFSDGVGDNLTAEELAEIGKGKSPEETIQAVSDITTQRMLRTDDLYAEAQNGWRAQYGTFSDGYRSLAKKDNRAIVVMDIL